MNGLNDREQRLLLLLSKSNAYSTSEGLASLLSVSSRTIKSDIKNINKYGNEYGFEIKSKKHYGYYIHIISQTAYNELLSFISKEKINRYKDIPENRIQRINFIIMKLLTVDYYIKIDDFADELFIDKSTFLSCLNEAKMILAKYHLTIVNIYKQGIIISGSEIDIRICIAEFFFHNNISKSFLTEDNIMFSNEHSLEEIRTIKSILIRICEHNSIQMSDYSLENMVIHIFVAIRRWLLYNFAKSEDKYLDYLYGTKELKAGIELVKELEKQYSIMLPFDESIYFAIHFKTKHIETDVDILNTDKNEIDDLIHQIFDAIQNKYGLSFHNDHELKKMLSLHLPPMLSRLKLNFTLRNASLYEYFRKYIFSYLLTFEARQIIKKRFDLELEINEYGFLVLYFNWALSRKKGKKKYHLLLLCGSGRPESILLINEINENLSNIIDNITVIDYKDIDTLDLKNSNYDILLSTIDIDSKDIPTITISSKDINNIKKIEYSLEKIRYNKIDFNKIIKKENVFFDIKGNTKYEVLNEIEKLLDKDNQKEFRYVKEIEKTLSSEVGNLISILHSSKRSSDIEIKFFITKKQVIWDKQLVKIIIWLSTDPKNIEEFEIIMEILSKFICKHENISNFLKKQNYEELINELNQYTCSLY